MDILKRSIYGLSVNDGGKAKYCFSQKLAIEEYKEDCNDIDKDIKKIKKDFMKNLVEKVVNKPSDHEPVYSMIENCVSWNLETKGTFISRRLKDFVRDYKNEMYYYYYDDFMCRNYLDRMDVDEDDINYLIDIKYNVIIDTIKEIKENKPGVKIFFQECDIELYEKLEGIFKYQKMIPRETVKLMLKNHKSKNQETLMDEFRQKIAEVFNKHELVGTNNVQQRNNFLNLQNQSYNELIAIDIKNVFNNYFEEVNQMSNYDDYGIGMLSDQDFIIVPLNTSLSYNFPGNDIKYKDSNNNEDYYFKLQSRNCAIITKNDDTFKHYINCHFRKDQINDYKNYLTKEFNKSDNMINCLWDKLLFDLNDDNLSGIWKYITNQDGISIHTFHNIINSEIVKIIYNKCFKKIIQISPKDIIDGLQNNDKPDTYINFIPRSILNNIQQVEEIIVLGDFNTGINIIREITHAVNQEVNGSGRILRCISNGTYQSDYIITIKYVKEKNTSESNSSRINRFSMNNVWSVLDSDDSDEE